MKDLFLAIDPYELSMKPIDRIGRRWMLITSGDLSSWNTMTASWGFLGELWSRPAASVFVRPSRFTYDFMERNAFFTLSFFPDAMRPALEICGSKSGRDTDKAEAAGLTPFDASQGAVAFEEAETILVCRKLYAQDIDPSLFTDPDIVDEAYPREDFHKMYVGAIEACMAKRED